MLSGGFPEDVMAGRNVKIGSGDEQSWIQQDLFLVLYALIIGIRQSTIGLTYKGIGLSITFTVAVYYFEVEF